VEYIPMKKYSAGILVSFIIILSVTAGCRKNYSLNENQVILFQFDYLNYAWGYQHHGFIIDTEGNVLKYDNPEGWNFPDSELNLTSARASENISKCIPVGKPIDKDELLRYASYINNIAQSKVTAIKNTGADGGTSQYICYQFDENSSTYKGHLLKMEGDFTCENLNYYSKRVAQWMKDIQGHPGN
jgi:hypothetical protein